MGAHCRGIGGRAAGCRRANPMLFIARWNLIVGRTLFVRSIARTNSFSTHSPRRNRRGFFFAPLQLLAADASIPCAWNPNRGRGVVGSPSWVDPHSPYPRSTQHAFSPGEIVGTFFWTSRAAVKSPGRRPAAGCVRRQLRPTGAARASTAPLVRETLTVARTFLPVRRTIKKSRTFGRRRFRPAAKRQCNP
jgi:hypothetical protein